MRLYAKRNNGTKVYLNVNKRIRSRHQLSKSLGSNNFFVGQERFNVNQVYAEDTINDTIGGAIMGCVVGFLAGPSGAVVGSIIGGAMGNSMDREDRLRIEEFNNDNY